MEENGLQPADIEKIKAQPTPVVKFKLWQENALETPEDYCFNTPYLIACAIHQIEPARWQDEATRQDPKILDFMKRVPCSIIVDEKDFGLALLEDSSNYQQRIEVVAKGNTFQEETVCTSGSCQLPKFRDTDDELLKKFRANTRDFLPESKIDSIVKTALELEKIENVGQLMELTSP
jgi:2-methylcitrate dehydratase PrpD